MTTEGFIDSRCPYCGREVSFPEAVGGLVEECPHCWECLIVPNDSQGTARKVPIPINTARLTLRSLQPGDSDDLLEFLSDKELFRYSEWETMDEDSIHQWLASKTAPKLTSLNEVFYLGIEHREHHKIIGLATVSLQDAALRRAALELMVSRPWQRQGFGAETIAAILGFLFLEIDQSRVVTSFDSRNVTAARLLKAAGMRCEGEAVKNSCFNGEWINTAYYAILREEYLVQKDRSAPPRRP